MEHRTGHDDLYTRLNEYCEQMSTPPGELLYRLERETHLKTLAPQMMSGRLQGQFLRMLSSWIKPQRILEIGTFTGYATLCLAEGLGKDGELHTIEANPEMAYLIRKYLKESGRQKQIRLHLGDAHAIIPDLPGSFDLVFIDAGKRDYEAYFHLIIDRVASGGCILADNVLWSGKVLTPDQDEDTASLHAFNALVRADERIENIILPLRDGLMLARKK